MERTLLDGQEPAARPSGTNQGWLLGRVARQDGGSASSTIRVTLPVDVIKRLEERARRAGFVTPSGKPHVTALYESLLAALGGTTRQNIHALAMDESDPDMGNFVLAFTSASAARNPPRWPSGLAPRVSLNRALLGRLQRRAELEALPGWGPTDLATLASVALCLAVDGRPSCDETTAAFIAEKADPDMKALCLALEHARAAARPS